ncbi:MAG: hypothetical protein Q9163_002433 [Psora crenata]
MKTQVQSDPSRRSKGSLLSWRDDSNKFIDLTNDSDGGNPPGLKGNDWRNSYFIDASTVSKNGLTNPVRHLDLTRNDNVQPPKIASPKRTSKGSEKQCTTRLAAVDVFANVTQDKRSQKSKNFSDAAPLGQSMLKAGQKRTLQDIQLNTLYDPKQVASKKEFEQYIQTKKRKLEENKQKEASRVHKEADKVQIIEDVKVFKDRDTANNEQTDEKGAKVIESKEIAPSSKELIRKTAISNIVEKEDAVSAPVSRPTISRKSISEATRATSTADTDEYTTTNNPDKPPETPGKIYAYLVSLRNWGIGWSERSAVTKTYGPFYTAAEANLTAETEVKYPLIPLEEMADPDLNNPYLLYSKTGWSYSYHQDEHGMQTHRLSAGGFNAEAAVRRGSPSASNTGKDDLSGETFDDDIAKNANPECEKAILGAYTVPDLANKHAGDHYIALVTQGMKNTGEEGILKQQIKTQVRQELREMEQDGLGELFNRRVEIEEVGETEGEGRRGMCVVWVEIVAIDGPRN